MTPASYQPTTDCCQINILTLHLLFHLHIRYWLVQSLPHTSYDEIRRTSHSWKSSEYVFEQDLYRARRTQTHHVQNQESLCRSSRSQAGYMSRLWSYESTGLVRVSTLYQKTMSARSIPPQGEQRKDGIFRWKPAHSIAFTSIYVKSTRNARTRSDKTSAACVSQILF